MKIDIDKIKFKKLIDLFVNCESCPAKNSECMCYKGTLATKDCIDSVLEWLEEKRNAIN